MTYLTSNPLRFYGALVAPLAVVGLGGLVGLARPTRLRLFYGAIVLTMVAGASLQSLGINPVRALYWAAVINGVLAAPLMVLMMLIVANPNAMGDLVLPSRERVTGWIATLVMAAATVIYFVFLLS